MYHPFAHKALFQLDPERAHGFTFQQLRCVTGTPFEALMRQKAPAKPVNYIGLTFKNPPGLVVGLDRDGECIDALGAMKSGSIGIGTVAPRPQSGNDKPRLFRLVNTKGLVSRTGPNNFGVDSPVENIKEAHYDSVLGINVGKNKDTPAEQGKDDYLICMEKIYAYAGYTAISISSSNTLGLRTLQYGEALDDLLTVTKNKQNDLQVMYHKYVPIAVKIVPDLSEEKLTQVAGGLVRHNIDDVIATSTTLDRSLVQGAKNCDQTGDLSGRPLQLKSTEIIRRLSQELNGRLPIISVGGTDSVIVAREKIAAGASLVQIYSGFILKDSLLIKEIVIHI